MSEYSNPSKKDQLNPEELKAKFKDLVSRLKEEFGDQFYDKFAELVKKRTNYYNNYIYIFSMIIIILIFVFFGYKLYKSLTERQRKKEEKQRQKQQKKKK